jgi:putative DNA primase/helicase
MNSDKKPFYEAVAEKLIEQLREGTAPWQKPWEPGQAGANMPINPTTGKRYKGINALQLISEGREDRRWMTYKQAAAVDAQVRKGEKGTPIQYWKFTEDQTRTDASGKPILDGRGEPVTQSVKLERPRVFFATVFNAEQIDGLPPPEPRKEQTWNAVERAEQILLASGALIRNGEHDRAFYRPATDSIHLPDKIRFPTADNYYATALHELGHWSGHESRLDRDLGHPFGSEGYAKEELRAEIASMILGDELGIGHDPEQHAAYVGSWIKALEDDPLEIFRAAADAEKIRDYVLGQEQQQVREQAASATLATGGHPAAFVDTNGMLRDWTTADRMPDDWQGVVKHQGAFWQVGQEAGERTFTVLAATSLQEAQAEAARHQALAVDVGVVLDHPDILESDFHEYQGPTLEDALRSRGLTTIGSVTGADTTKFLETAGERLHAVFGIEAGTFGMRDVFVEHSVLTKAFAAKAEQLMMPLQQLGMEAGMAVSQRNDTAAAGAEHAEAWMLARVEHSTVARAADIASLAQINRMGAALEAMEPLNSQNPFWQRHKMPQETQPLQEKIDSAKELIELRKADAHVAAARLALVTGRAFGRQRQGDGETFDREAEDVLGFALPIDWNGRVRVEGFATETVDGQQVFTTILPKGVEPEAWGVFAQHSYGNFAMLTSFPTQQQADELAERLAVIDAHSTINEHEKAVKLARINEDRVRRDPNSTDEDISAAKEARKNAEFSATTNDEDLQRRIEFEERELAQQAARADAGDGHPNAAKVLIDVPYKQKDEVKALGAKWDRQEQSWYVPSGVDPSPFAQWAQKAVKTPAGDEKPVAVDADNKPAPKRTESRLYLAVPYNERGAARAAGAVWDKGAKSWYAGSNADMAKLDQWKPENVPAQQGPAMTPREEFAKALESVGCVLSGDHPIMDGQKHRITVAGEKFTKKSGSGFYVGHLDGHPAGYMKNNRTGVDLTWKSKGYALNPEQKALMAAEAAAKLQQREAELSKLQDQAAKRVVKQMAKLVPVEQPTRYMLSKGIEPHGGAFTDKDGKKTYLPAVDADGKQWTMQYIQENGTKRFAKDSRKDGCFHAVGGMDELAKAPVLVIGEGYATAVSLRQSLSFATVSAFDSGNLAQVAQALHRKFPDKPVVIAGDDDRHLELVQGVNPGRTKAEEAARLVGGKVLLPIFAPGENSYPADLDPITPKKYREHQGTGNTLSDEQLAALGRIKQYTDFNDLATKSALGKEGIDRQVRSLVDAVIEKHNLAQAEQRTQEQGPGQAQETAQAEKPKRRRAATVA